MSTSPSFMQANGSTIIPPPVNFPLNNISKIELTLSLPVVATLTPSISMVNTSYSILPRIDCSSVATA